MGKNEQRDLVYWENIPNQLGARRIGTRGIVGDYDPFLKSENSTESFDPDAARRFIRIASENISGLLALGGFVSGDGDISPGWQVEGLTPPLFASLEKLSLIRIKAARLNNVALDQPVVPHAFVYFVSPHFIDHLAQVPGSVYYVSEDTGEGPAGVNLEPFFQALSNYADREMGKQGVGGKFNSHDFVRAVRRSMINYEIPGRRGKEGLFLGGDGI